MKMKKKEKKVQHIKNQKQFKKKNQKKNQEKFIQH